MTRAYQYQYTDPMSGKPVWRSKGEPWNGQTPKQTEALYSVEQIAALAAQPRDDVRELLREARGSIDHAIKHNETLHITDKFSRWFNAAVSIRARIDTALSQTDEQPAIPDMTDAECATAYRDLRRRANDAGFATVGEWIDEQPDTDGGIPVDFYQWLQTIDADVRVWDLTPNEVRELRAALCTDRKAGLEEAAKVADDHIFSSPDDDYQLGQTEAAQSIALSIRALAEGEGK